MVVRFTVVYYMLVSTFDCIDYGKLFNILLSRKLPAFIIHVLFDSYSRQQSGAIWNSCYTDYFYMSNGVK